MQSSHEIAVLHSQTLLFVKNKICILQINEVTTLCRAHTLQTLGSPSCLPNPHLAVNLLFKKLFIVQILKFSLMVL